LPPILDNKRSVSSLVKSLTLVKYFGLYDFVIIISLFYIAASAYAFFQNKITAHFNPELYISPASQVSFYKNHMQL